MPESLESLIGKYGEPLMSGAKTVSFIKASEYQMYIILCNVTLNNRKGNSSSRKRNTKHTPTSQAKHTHTRTDTHMPPIMHQHVYIHKIKVKTCLKDRLRIKITNQQRLYFPNGQFKLKLASKPNPTLNKGRISFPADGL